jgi:hypothetical protein
VLIPLSRFGLVTAREFARRHRRAAQTVLRWISEERFPAVPIRARGATMYLLRRADCEAFRPPKLGAPSWAEGARR